MERPQRRLAAILAADVVGYSRLMAADEAGTLAQFKALRAELIDPKIAQFTGHIVGTAGDSLLVEFASAVDAVQFAVEAQEQVATRNADIPEDRRIVFRIGINLGDVMAEGGTIHGDGVNVAARLEKLAEPGSVLVARSVHDQIKGKVLHRFEDLGEKTLHNIDEPVRVYRVAVAVSLRPEADAGPARQEEKATVAVLPFLNLSSDPEQEYFADGITEDIITDLSRWRQLAVMSRNSTFQFKGKAVDSQRVGRELGARYVVEGSVRRMGERIRVTAQLIDAETGNHVWAERFDRPMEDLFAVQDEMVRTIVGTLVGRVQASAVERAGRKPPSNWAAYDYMLRGNALPWDDPTMRIEAKRLFEKAIEIDPGYGLAHALLALMFEREWMSDYSGSREALDRAFALAQRAVELNPDESTCHVILAQIYLDFGLFDSAQWHMERGVEINPVNQWNLADLGGLYAYIGRADDAIELLLDARRRDPFLGPSWYWRSLGVACLVARRYEDALAAFDRVTTCPPRVHALMAGCHAKLGRMDLAGEHLSQCLAARPDCAIGELITKYPFKHASDTEHLVACLRLAGLPE